MSTTQEIESSPVQPATTNSRASFGRFFAHAFALMLVLRIVCIAGIVILSIGRTEQQMFQGDAAGFAMTGGVALAAAAVLGLGLLRPTGISLRQLGWRTDDLASEIALGVLGFTVSAVMVIQLSVVFRTGTWDEAFSAVAHYTISQRLLFASIGLVMGVAEETLYRGFVQPGLVDRLGAAKGILLTAALFSLLHLQPKPLQLLSRFLGGLVLCLLRARRGSLVGATVTHGLTWAVLGSL